jgi:DNA-binding NarL/FixJ family response regulator
MELAQTIGMFGSGQALQRAASEGPLAVREKCQVTPEARLGRDSALNFHNGRGISLSMPRLGSITVVIVDDHPLFRQGMRQAVQEDSRFELLGESDNGPAALELIQKLRPDVAVLDVNLPGMSGLEVAAQLHAKKSKTDLVVLTMLKDEPAFNKALNLGIKGYVLKDSAANEILNCIASVASGEAYVSPLLTDFLLRRRNRAETLSSHQPGLDDLTVAERRILKRIALGQTTKEIAAELFVSPRTVESHRANICNKLKLTGANRLLQFALENRDSLSHLD